jgi:hypothetical protein
MKKLAVILSLAAMASAAFGQGSVTFNNSSLQFARTNAIGLAGTAGNAGPAVQGFYYGVFTAASTVTTIDASLQALLSPTWTFTGSYATNSAAATGGRISGGTQNTGTGWEAGVTNSYLVVGWSASLGHDWTVVRNLLQGASLVNGVWTGGAFSVQGAFLGASTIAFGAAGGGTTGNPAFSLFGTTPTGQGTPIPGGFDMFVVSVPEPSSFALAGLGAAALLIFRRRK